jgi:hypothetical protein
MEKIKKPDVLEEVIKEAIRAVQEMRLSLRVVASRYKMTHTALYYRIKKSEIVTTAFGATCLFHVTQVSSVHCE